VTAAQALIGFAVMAALFVASVAMLANPAWAMMAASIIGSIAIVLLYDPRASRTNARAARNRLRMARLRAGKQR